MPAAVPAAGPVAGAAVPAHERPPLRGQWSVRTWSGWETSATEKKKDICTYMQGSIQWEGSFLPPPPSLFLNTLHSHGASLATSLLPYS